MDPAFEAKLCFYGELVLNMAFIGACAAPFVYFLPAVTGFKIFGDVSKEDSIGNVISELVLTPPDDGAANDLDLASGYGSSAPEPSNVYYYCSGLDVSAGGTIDCGSTPETTTAEVATESAQSTPYSTLRFSFATTDGEEEEEEEEVALKPEQAMSHSELFMASFATDEHPDVREDTKETPEAAQADSTVVFLQKAKAPGSSAFQAPFGYTRVLPGARPELHVFSPTDIAFLQGSTSTVLTDAAPAAATNARLDTKDRVNAHPHPVRSRLLKPVPRMDLEQDLGAKEVFGTSFWKTSIVDDHALLTRGQLSVLHHHPHLYEHRADGGGEFSLSFLTSGAAEPGQFDHDLEGGKVDTWDPRALGEHANDHLVGTQGIPLDCVWLDFGPAADRARRVKPRMRGGRKEDWRLPRLAQFGLEETGRACVGPDGDVEDATAKQVLWTLFAPELDVKECLGLTRDLADDSLPVDRLCAIEAGPVRDWAGPVLKETAEDAIADWPSDLVSDDLLLASGTLSEATSLAVAFRRRQLLLLEHLVQGPSPAVMGAKGHVIERIRRGRSNRRGARNDFLGLADLWSWFNGAPFAKAGPAPMDQAEALSVASHVNPVAHRENAATLPSAREEERTVNAWGAPFASMGDVLKPLKAVVLEERLPEENDRQAPLSQPIHDMESLETSPPTKDLLAQSEGDPRTEELPTTIEKAFLPVTYCYVGPGLVSTTPQYMLDRIEALRTQERPTTIENMLLPAIYSYVGPGAASTTPGVSGSASTKSEAVAHSDEKRAGADTTLSSLGSDRPTGLGLRGVAMSETVVSNVTFSAQQGLDDAPTSETVLSDVTFSATQGLDDAVTSETVASGVTFSATQGLNDAATSETVVSDVTFPAQQGLDDAATSETVASDVTCSATQGLTAVFDHPVCTWSDKPDVDAGRSTGGTSEAFESPSTNIAGGAQGLATAEVTEEAAAVPDLESQSGGGAWPAIPSPFDIKGASAEDLQVWWEASQYRRRHPFDESTLEYYRQWDLHRERQRSEAEMPQTAPLPGA